MFYVISFLTLLFEFYSILVTTDFIVGIICFMVFMALVGLVKIFIRGYGNTGKLLD